MTDAQPPPAEGLETRGTPVSPDDKSVSELISDMTSQLSTLLHKEVEMAVAELRDEAKQAAKAGGMLGAGAFAGYLAAVLAAFGLAWWFDRKLPRWVAFFLVAGLHGAAAAALLKRGAEEMKQVDPVPQQTIDSLKDNVEWVKAQAG
jgi:hypothetical protein